MALHIVGGHWSCPLWFVLWTGRAPACFSGPPEHLKSGHIADEGVAVEHTMPARIRLRIGSRPEDAVAAAAENGNGNA
jgi:hypothetical protein